METQKTCYGVPYQTNKIVPKFCKRIENFWNIIVTCECSGKVIWFIMIYVGKTIFEDVK